MLSITDLKKGTLFSLDGEPFKVVDYGQKVMGRGGSIVNVRIKSLVNGRVLEKTFKGNERLESADISTQSVQYLYSDNSSYYFMNQVSFEQFELSKELVKDNAGFIKEGDIVQLQLYKDRPILIDLPKNVALRVERTEDVVKGDTSTAVTKNAELETGISLKVPAFIRKGDLISVDTSSGTYRERLKG